MIAAAKSPTDIAGFDPTAGADGYYYDHDRAEHPLDFFRTALVHTKGVCAGQPLELEPWQQNIVRTLFGWLDGRGLRRFRRAYIEVARKNGKTTLVAAIALYVLLCDGEPGAECYCSAADADQATLLYSIAATMARKNPEIDAAVKIRDSVKRIIYKDSFFRAIPADAKGSHGFNSHLNCNDELHAWQGREFYDVLQTGFASRTQPLQIDITTAGWDRHSICWQQHEYAERVRDGRTKDPKYLPVIYCVDEDDDWQDVDNWRKANPNLEVSVSLEYLKSQYHRAVEEPAFENTFRRLHLNQWTSQETRWLKMDQWRNCRVGHAIEPKAQIACGLDLSTKIDLTALCLCEKRENGYRMEWRFWLPEDRLDELEARDGVPYRQWQQQGWLDTTPGSTIDYRYIKTAIAETAEKYVVGAIGYDPWNAESLRQEIEDELGVTMIALRQGVITLSAPSKELERCVIDGVLDHGDNPIAEWMAESCQVKVDDNHNIKPIRPDRYQSGKKIDGIMAAVMAIAALDGMQVEPGSIYDTAGSLEL